MHCWWECRMVQPLWKTVWNFHKKLKMELPFDLAIPLLGLYPKNSETPIQKNLLIHPNVHSITIYNSQMLDATSVPISKWVNKKTGTFTQWNSTQQKKRVLPFVKAWMEPGSIMLSEISQPVKDKYHMISPIKWNLINKTSKHNCNWITIKK